MVQTTRAMLSCLVLCGVNAAVVKQAGAGSLRGASITVDLRGVGNRTFSSVDAFVHDLVVGDGSVQMSRIVRDASELVGFTDAVRSLQQAHKLPVVVSSLLTARNAANRSHKLDEDSLEKARKFLNGLVEAAYKELDDKIIEAKEFEARNRGTWQQVVADIARLGSQIADHTRNSAEATACIANMGRQIDSVKEQRQEERDAYEKEYAERYADLQIKQNDLAVFDFLIKTTKKICDQQAAGLLQATAGNKAPPPGLVPQSMQVCGSGENVVLRFVDPSLQAKFDRVLIKGSRDLLAHALMRMETGFLQSAQPVTKATAKVPVTSGQSDSLGDLKCGPIPDCGLLYDTLSLNWGGYKDQVDELKKTMASSAAEWKELNSQFDVQIASLTASSDECVGQLAEATANMNSDRQILAQKVEDKRVLDDEHKKTMKEFKDRIKYIFYQDIWGPIAVRNEVMKESTECPPKTIDDCDVTSWTPQACSVDCDDNCPDDIGCGGVQTLTRDAVVRPNECGIKCPELKVNRKCNQFKCPVDCLMSKWSGWSKCSKDCEGGLQERTRSVLTKPRHGGNGCTAVSDGRPCNTGSCDRDCTLEDWTSWSPCSMACNRGNQARTRPVDVPIRGGGKCPRPTSSHRLERQDCNVNACVGDEICIAKQDLIIAVDGSGSVNAESWKLVRNFTGELLVRYKAEYHGEEKVHIGVVLFGNGAIEDDGTVSKALLISELSADMATTREAAAAMEHQRGFTNMAQGFVLAEKLLLQRGRKQAQSAVMTISDGKPSFLFETTEKAKELDDKGIMKFMVGIAEFPKSDSWQLLRTLATEPADTNTVRVPGFDALQDGGGPFVREAIAKFCPHALSASQTLQEEEASGYMLVRTGGYCGNMGTTLSRNTVTPDECFRLAMNVDAHAFSMGRKYRRGKCCVERLEFGCDTYHQWLNNPEHPECPSGGGGFQGSRYYDWYAVEPNCAI